MSEFEKAVRKALIDREMSLSDLAREIGISISYMYEVLRGTRRSEEQIQKIRDYLDLGGVVDDRPKIDNSYSG